MRPTRQDWKQWIEGERRVPRLARRAVVYHGQWSSYSRPIRVTVEPASGTQSIPGSQDQYVVKARWDGFREVEVPRRRPSTTWSGLGQCHLRGYQLR